MSDATENTVSTSEYIPAHGHGKLTPWQKGTSGNPGGLGGAYREAKALCANKSLRAAQRLVELIEDQDGRIAYMACMAVLERGIGKPREHAEEPARVDLTALSDDERKAMAALLRKALGVL